MRILLENKVNTISVTTTTGPVRGVRNITSYLSHGSHKVTVYAVAELPTSKFLGEQLAFYDLVVY